MFRLLFCTTHRLSDYVHRDSVFCPLVRVSVYVANELVQCFSFQNLCDAQKGAYYVHRDSVFVCTSLRDCMRFAAACAVVADDRRT